MASLHDVTVGQDIEFKRVLAKAGMDYDMVESIIRQPALADSMVSYLREQLASPLPQLFVSLEVQLANVRNWNQMRGWGFTDSDFDSIDLTPGDHSGLVVDVIAVFLPDQGKTSRIQRTFEELWDIASSISSRTSGATGSLKSDPKHLRLLDGIEHVPWHPPGNARPRCQLGHHQRHPPRRRSRQGLGSRRGSGRSGSLPGLGSGHGWRARPLRVDAWLPGGDPRRGLARRAVPPLVLGLPRGRAGRPLGWRPRLQLGLPGA